MTPLSLEGDLNHYQVSVGHIPPQGQPPLVEAASTVTLSSSAALRQLWQEAEHRGCVSGRAFGLHLVRHAVSDQRFICKFTNGELFAHVSGSGHGHAIESRATSPEASAFASAMVQVPPLRHVAEIPLSKAELCSIQDIVAAINKRLHNE